jgi:hypothetical protein
MINSNESLQALAAQAQEHRNTITHQQAHAQPVSRRTFLIGTGAACAALLVTPTLLAGCSPSNVLPPNLQWSGANESGILRDASADIWNSGHVNDLLELSPVGDALRQIVVGTDSGGVWIVDEQGHTSGPLSDFWENPDVRCLAAGPDGPTHVFAACSRVAPDSKNTCT